MKSFSMNNILSWTEMYIICFGSLLFMKLIHLDTLVFTDLHDRIIWSNGVSVSSLDDIFSLVPRICTVLVKTSSYSLITRRHYQWLEHCIIFIDSNVDVALQYSSFFIYIRPKNHFTLLVAEPIQKCVYFSQDLTSRGPIAMGVVEHCAKNMSMNGWYLCWKRNSLSLNHLQICFHTHAMITRLASKHLIEDDPKSPNIAFLWVMVLLVRLRRHVFGRTHIIVQLWLVGNLLHLAIAEVYDGYFLAFLRIALKEDVIWLEVSMYYLLIPHMCISFNYLPKNEKSIILVEPLRVSLDIIG